jgi:poly(3-hydroxyalkanoate) synthetase
MLANEMGFTVYVIDHLPATQATKDYSIQDIVVEMDIAFCHTCAKSQNWDKIHIIGLCQGGWAAAIWAALHPSYSYASLTTAGSPIDFKTDGGKIQNFLDFTPDVFFENIVNYYDGLWPGDKQLTGFKMLNPADRYIGNNVQLHKAIISGDENAVKKWIRNNSWYETAHDLPGRMILDVIKKLFRGNQLIKGELVVFGRKVVLSDIKCPVAVITGENDDITLTRQATALLYATDKKGVKIHQDIAGTGHIGIYLKRSSLDIFKSVMETLIVEGVWL